ncbi:hypothetical protein C1645_833076 [Glomus cerebriforme]|uniref:HMG box domain-containing protein n=1 Tax=Glomus cerebriforme TaxID=658196 RepID=A0A397SGR9_9GLOM|nr:hypothetical protein C1645_833076 [Glomus cerebriforme]
MPPIFPSNYTYPKQGYVIPFSKPTQMEKFYIFDDNMIENVINSIISKAEQNEIENFTFLPLVDLVKPRVKKVKDKAPRSQNVFVIFRKDQQARLTYENGPSFTAELKVVSEIVSKLWREITPETKALYDRVGYITKQVHKHIWPNYSYKPNRREHRPLPSPPPSNCFSSPVSSLSSTFTSSVYPLPQQYAYPPSKYPLLSYHQNKDSISPISSFSPSIYPLLPYHQNKYHLLEINPSNTMNDQYDNHLRNSLNKYARMSL